MFHFLYSQGPTLPYSQGSTLSYYKVSIFLLAALVTRSKCIYSQGLDSITYKVYITLQVAASIAHEAQISYSQAPQSIATTAFFIHK